MRLREILPEERETFEEYCDREWEHGGVAVPVSKLDIEAPPLKDTVKMHLVAEVDETVAAGLTIQFNEQMKKGFYGTSYFLDMWVRKEFRGQVENEILEKCDTTMKERGIDVAGTRIPDYSSRFAHIFKEAGYEEKYKEETFVREAKKPLNDLILSYYEKTKEKVNFRVSKNMDEDMQTYLDLVDKISGDVENIQPLDSDYLLGMADRTQHTVGIWIFAEVDTVPAGYIVGSVAFQKFMGKKGAVGKIINNGVLKQFRGMGIGTALYVRMIEEMRRWNIENIIDYMILEDNVPEKTLLGELGFESAQKHVLVVKNL